MKGMPAIWDEISSHTWATNDMKTTFNHPKLWVIEKNTNLVGRGQRLILSV